MTIYDIAEKAGVSIATVSRVINGSSNVSEKSRKKVLEVMEREGYIPNVFARGLTLNSIKTIGILCPVISDINHAKPVSILENLLRENKFDTLLSCANSNTEDKSKYLQLLFNKRVDAIIVIGSSIKEMNDAKHFEEIAKNIPIIIINGFVKMENVYSVLCDEESAIIECVEHLNKQNHKNILYMYDSETFSGYQKLSGYKKGLRECGIEENPDLIVKIDDGENSIEDAYDAMMDIINSSIKFDALIAADDIIAVGALKALQQKNIDIPIIGFNNSRFAQCTTPEITSIDNMMETVSSTAINVLMDVLNGKDAPQKIIISPKLVERDTFRI